MRSQDPQLLLQQEHFECQSPLQYDWDASLSVILQLSIVPKSMAEPSTSATAPVSAIYAYQLPSLVGVIATASPPTVTSGKPGW